jgi:hypothetical protein
MFKEIFPGMVTFLSKILHHLVHTLETHMCIGGSSILERDFFLRFIDVWFTQV